MNILVDGIMRNQHKTKGHDGVLTEEMNYNILSIEAVENSDLNEQLSFLLTERKLDTDENIEYYEQTIFTRLPPILIISINRTKFEDGVKYKNKCRFPFNNEISIDYCTEDDLNSKEYILFSIIVHIGDSIDTGHYISFVAEFDDTGNTVKWHEFNDKFVYYVDEKRVVDISFGSDEFSSAILFYVSKENISFITIHNAAYFGGLIKQRIKELN